MKRTWWLAGVLMMVVTSACAQGQQDAGEGVRVGQPAPPFELPSAGGRVSLSDFKGQDVLLYYSMGPG